jgi:hypothetical protein
MPSDPALSIRVGPCAGWVEAERWRTFDEFTELLVALDRLADTVPFRPV